MDKILSIRSNNYIFSLFAKIQAFQKSANRTEIVNAAITKALNDKVDWTEISNIKYPIIPNEQINTPNFIQLRVNADEYNRLSMQMHEAFHLEKMPPAPYVIKLILTNYLIYLNDMHSQSLQDNVLTSNNLMNPDEFNALTSIDEKLNQIYKLLYKMNISSF